MSLWQLWRHVHRAFKKKFGVEFRAERKAEGVSLMRVDYFGTEMVVIWDFNEVPGMVHLGVMGGPTVEMNAVSGDPVILLEYIGEAMRILRFPEVDFVAA